MIWKANAPAVSVGRFEDGEHKLTRQIINVAAGISDADAVNVAQLKKVKEYVDKSIIDTNIRTKDGLIVESEKKGNLKTFTIALDEEIKSKVDSIGLGEVNSGVKILLQEIQFTMH